MFEGSPFKIDGIPVKPPQNRGSDDIYEPNRLAIAGNDLLGNYWEFTIVEKDKYFWVYNHITAEELKFIEDIVRPKIDSRNNDFMITSWTPRGFVTKRCYLGSSNRYKVLASHNGEPSILSTFYHWIQIEGADILPF